MPHVALPRTTIRVGATLAVAMLGAIAEASSSPQPDQQQVKRLSIEELMNVDVTLASRRPEPVGATPLHDHHAECSLRVVLTLRSR